MSEPTPNPNPLFAQGSMLRQIRQEWVDFLESLPYFENIPIIIEDKDEIDAEAEKGLGPNKVSDAATVGICIIIFTVTAHPSNTGEQGPIFDEIKMMARVLENVETNRKGGNGTKKSYEEVAEKIYGFSQGFRPLSGRGPMVAVPPGIVLANDENWPGKDVFMELPGSLAITLDQLPTPTIINNNGVITMTCETPGAAVFYMLNNRKPNPRSSLYLEAITPDAGTTIKARAWLSGYLASEIATLTV